MLYNVASSFVKIDETQGIIQNASSGNSIEVSSQNTADSGIILKPGESLSFTDTDIYVRTIGNKNSSVRVVPFVDGFSAGSVSSDFDVRKYDTTGILIYSTDAGGNLVEKPIHYVNPEATNAQLVEFGKSIVATTDNTYQATYRVNKSLCDGQNDPTDYSKYLIVDSPFTEDLTDKCGKTWQIGGNPQIQDGRLYLDGSSYLSLPDLTLGGKNFTIQMDFFMQTSTPQYGRLFQFGNSAVNNLFYCERQGSGTGPLLQMNGRSPLFNKAFANINVGWANVGFAIVNNQRRLFIEVADQTYNETLTVYTPNYPLSSIHVTATAATNGTFCLGCDYAKNSRMQGYISNVKIYDGVALHAQLFQDVFG